MKEYKVFFQDSKCLMLISAKSARIARQIFNKQITFKLLRGRGKEDEGDKKCPKCGEGMYSSDKGKHWYHNYTYCADCPKESVVGKKEPVGKKFSRLLKELPNKELQEKEEKKGKGATMSADINKEIKAVEYIISSAKRYKEYLQLKKSRFLRLIHPFKWDWARIMWKDSDKHIEKDLQYLRIIQKQKK